MSSGQVALAAEASTSAAPSRPVPPPFSTGESACTSCRGKGWKFVVRRSAMRVMAYTCERTDASFRRPCLDCGGSGRGAAS